MKGVINSRFTSNITCFNNDRYIDFYHHIYFLKNIRYLSSTQWHEEYTRFDRSIESKIQQNFKTEFHFRFIELFAR